MYYMKLAVLNHLYHAIYILLPLKACKLLKTFIVQIAIKARDLAIDKN